MRISWRKVIFWVALTIGVGVLIAGAFISPLLAVGAGIIAGAAAFGAVFIQENHNPILVDEPEAREHVELDIGFHVEQSKEGCKVELRPVEVYHLSVDEKDEPSPKPRV